AVVQSLHAQGLLHIDEAETALDDENSVVETDSGVEESEAPFFNPVNLEGDAQQELVSFENMARSLSEALPLLLTQPSADEVSAFLSHVVALSEEKWTQSLREKTSVIRDLTRRRAALRDNIDVLHNYRLILKQVLPALGGPNTVLGKGTRAIVLSGDVDRAAAQLRERFDEELGSDCEFLYNKTDDTALVGLVSFPEGKGDTVSSILSSQGISPVDLSDEDYQDATIAQVISRLEAAMEKQREQVYGLRTELETASMASGPELLAMKSVVADKLAQLRVKTQFAESQMVTVIQGWIPEDQYSALESAVESEFPGQVDVNRIKREGSGHQSIPTLLSNPKLFKPFEVVLKLFKPPTYGTIDPTIMVAISFIVFYGFIVGDVVYGIVIWLTAHALGKKLAHIPAGVDVSKVGKWMGGSSMFFGVLYGEYAGEWFPGLLGIPHLWFHRGHELNQLLLYALYMGIFHIIFALCTSVWQNFKHHHMKHGFEKLGMLLGVLALNIVSFGYFEVAPFDAPNMQILAGILFFVGGVLIIWSMGIILGAVGILEVLSLGGNIISYARLMALGVFAVSIADLANELPAAAGYMIGIPAAIALHAANIAVSMASPMIHSLRLNFVEFLPKFYAPEGRVFNPFKKETIS
ncbi:MAG: hypothetical protein QGG73_05790, partial [Candidatus Hydrogenedentes bacterium]|nr:hypothetical protein [Candidatus Hydrogenedentota bacterium]